MPRGLQYPLKGLEDCCHFGEDGLGGLGGVGSLGDGSADDEVASSLAESVSGGGDPLLVGDLGAGGADAGNDQDTFRAGDGSEGGDFLRRADEAANAGGQAGAGEEFGLLGGRTVEADGGDLGLIHAGEDSDREEFRGIGEAVEASMAGPPPAWMVIMRTPSEAAERTAPATVLGIS